MKECGGSGLLCSAQFCRHQAGRRAGGALGASELGRLAFLDPTFFGFFWHADFFLDFKSLFFWLVWTFWTFGLLDFWTFRLFGDDELPCLIACVYRSDGLESRALRRLGLIAVRCVGLGWAGHTPTCFFTTLLGWQWVLVWLAGGEASRELWRDGALDSSFVAPSRA